MPAQRGPKGMKENRDLQTITVYMEAVLKTPKTLSSGEKSDKSESRREEDGPLT